MRARPSVALPLLLLAACSGSSTPAPDAPAERDAEGNVKPPSVAQATNILQAAFDREPQCTLFHSMPRDIPAGPEHSYDRQQMQVFVDAGIVRREGEVSKPRESNPAVQDTYDRYVATPEGKKYIRPGPGNRTRICYGRRKIESLEVLPPDTFHDEIDVRYRFKLADVPAWARSPLVQAAFPGFKSRLDDPDESRETLRVRDGRWTFDTVTDFKMYDFGVESH